MRDSVRGPPLALPLPADAVYAPNAAWYGQREPIRVDGEGLIMYGMPRVLEEGSVRRIGTLHGVGVYAEMGTVGFPDVVYVPLSPDGMFQPYQHMTGNGCR